MKFYSTNNKEEQVDFKTALLKGMASNYGLYMFSKENTPKLSKETIMSMKKMPYHEIAFTVLFPFLKEEISEEKLKEILKDAYDESKIFTKMENLTGKTNIMWLTDGPTYSFKDYAARFFARMLNHFLGEIKKRRTVIVATSGDTGGAVADALFGLDNVENIVFYPKGSISPGQRRQMTTLGDNIYAFEVNGDFDVCQALAKFLLGDKEFIKENFDDTERFTSANSISLGRLLPQSVYPFYAYSRLANNYEEMIACVPSGNFGDMMGTVIAKEMGLPIPKILIGLNPNKPFLEFLKKGIYEVKESIDTPSSAMKVTHPSNLARLFDYYDGHIYDERNEETGKVTKEGIISKMPDIEKMKNDFFVHSITNQEHYDAIKEVYEKFNIILDPHGAVGWETVKKYLDNKHDKLCVIYETADPGKFPDDVKKAIDIIPDLPSGMKKQKEKKERIFSIDSEPLRTENGLKLSDDQIKEAKNKIRDIFK